MWLYHKVMSPNNADEMANSVDSDQTAPLGAVWSGSALFAQAYLSENLGSLRYWKKHISFIRPTMVVQPSNLSWTIILLSTGYQWFCRLYFSLLVLYLSRNMTKSTKWYVRPAKTQISLAIRPVWSEPSLCAQWVAKGSVLLQADSETSGQSGRMHRLIWVVAGSTRHFVGSCCGSILAKQNSHLLGKNGTLGFPFALCYILGISWCLCSFRVWWLGLDVEFDCSWSLPFHLSIYRKYNRMSCGNFWFTKAISVTNAPFPPYAITLFQYK